MTDFDHGTDHMGVPLRYSAEWHYGGCLPDTDVLLWDTPREAWNDLIERLSESDLMWVPQFADDPDGPLECTEFNLTLQRMADDDEPGTVSGPDGYLYSVEDTHVMTCGEPACGRTFPDLYPAGRCPYEANHAIYAAFDTAIATAFAFSRAMGAR